MHKHTWSVTFLACTILLVTALLVTPSPVFAHNLDGKRDSAIVVTDATVSSDATSAAPIGDDDAPFDEVNTEPRSAGKAASQKWLTEVIDEEWSFGQTFILWLRNIREALR
jgi:hypothetical protein